MKLTLSFQLEKDDDKDEKITKIVEMLKDNGFEMAGAFYNVCVSGVSSTPFGNNISAHYANTGYANPYFTTTVNYDTYVKSVTFVGGETMINQLLQIISIMEL